MKKKILFLILPPVVLILLLALAQELLIPKYMEQSREGALIAEYYRDHTAHEVLFLGDCEVYENFTPPTLWEEYGITSFVRGSPQQLIWQSYYLLEDSLRYETPDAVVFNVYALRYGSPQDEAYNRMTLDGMRFGEAKLRAVSASMTEEESFASYLFPLLRFHSRWKDLSSEDFRYLFRRDTVSHNGYLMQKGVIPKTSEREGDLLIDYTLPETSMAYLEKMRVLCEENRIELILIKAPTNTWKYYWYDEWDEQVSAYAEEHGLSYYNFIPLCEEIGIDWNTDTYDGGIHLNVTGAEKLTHYFGRILSGDHGIRDLRGDAELCVAWEEKTERYYSERNEEP